MSALRNNDIVAQYFIGGASLGEKIRIGFGIDATLRKQYNNLARGGDVGIDLSIEGLIIPVRSSDREQNCSLFSFGDNFYNIRGDGYTNSHDGTFLRYVVGVTDPETSPCSMHALQREIEPRTD